MLIYALSCMKKRARSPLLGLLAGWALGYTMAFMPRALAMAANTAVSTLMTVFQVLFIGEFL